MVQLHLFFEMAESVLKIPDQPFHPRDLNFPFNLFGQSKPVVRSFQVSLCQQFKWLHYDAPMDAAFCFTCCKALKLKSTTDMSFLVRRFKYWKDATCLWKL